MPNKKKKTDDSADSIFGDKSLMETIEKEVQESFDAVPGHYGKFEEAEERIRRLERAVARLYGWIAQQHRLSEEEIYIEGGLIDF